MKKRFRRKWKRIVVTILLVSICSACGKAQEDHMAADIADRAALGSEQAVEMEAAVRTVGESVTDGEEAVQTAEASAIEETETSESGESTTTEMSEDENKEAGWDVDFEIKREAYHCNEERNDINIYYPQLTGFVDAAKEERINALIEEDAKLRGKAVATTIDMEEEKVIALKTLLMFQNWEICCWRINLKTLRCGTGVY